MTDLYLSSESMDFLEHFGVKGMRWGVRKDKKGSSLTPEQEKKAVRTGQIAGVAIFVGPFLAKAGVQKVKTWAKNNPDKIIKAAKAVNKVVRPHVRPSDSPLNDAANIVDVVWND